MAGQTSGAIVNDPTKQKDVFAPPTGETPYANEVAAGINRKQPGAGGSLTTGNILAWDDFTKIFGRNPTPSELSMLAPTYQSGDANLANRGQGGAAISQYYQSLANSPDRIYASQQKKYLEQAPQHFDSINQLFQSQLGRAASQDELNHFGSLLASGTTDSYQLQQFLQQQPEYQTKQNEQMRQGLGSTMASNDRRQFSEQILPSIQEAYAKQGRNFDSSAFANSATNAAQAQNTNRENFLTNLTAQQYGGVQDRAYQDYANQVAQQQSLTNSGIQAQYGGMQNLNNRVNQITDFNTQSQLYNQYLSRYGKRNSGLASGLQGAIGGAMVGAKFGPWGAVAGGLAGGALGAGAGGSY